MKQHFDMAIVGAGPAGSTCANAALQTGAATIALIDRAEFPRDKSCGDGIGAGVLGILERIDLLEAVAGRPTITRLSMNVFNKVHAAYDTDALGRPSPFAHVIARIEFDDILVKAALRRGATDLTGWALQTMRWTGTLWEIDLARADGQTRQITATILVGADGARSRVRRALGFALDPDARTGVAVRAYADVPVAERGFARLDILPDMPFPGYGWLFSDGSGRANIGVGSAVPAWKAAHARFDDQLARYRAHLGDQVTGPLRDQASGVLSSGYRRGRLVVIDKNAALVGDAASMINPAIGEGIFFGMYAGLLLGEALAGVFSGSSTPQQALRQYQAGFARAFGSNFRESQILFGLTSRGWFLERMISGGTFNAELLVDFTETVMGVMPPGKGRSMTMIIGQMMLQGLVQRTGRGGTK